MQTHISFLADGVVNDIVVFDNFFLDGIGQILHTCILLLEVNVAETAIKEYFARIQLEKQTQLRIVDHGIASEVEEGIVEIGQGLFEIAEEKIGNALLEIRDGEVLIEANGSLVTFNL